MKFASVVSVLALACSSSLLAANPDKDAAKAVIAAVKQGADLMSKFPGAIDATQAASLQRVTKCSALNLMKQQGGYYTVVWDCGSKGALGMRVVVAAGKVTSISTMEIGMRPNAH